MKKNRLFVVLFAFVLLRGFSQEQTDVVLPIIPKPKEIVVNPGQFVLSSSTKIVSIVTASKNQAIDLNNEIDYIKEYLNRFYNIDLKIINTVPQDGNYIIFETSHKEIGNKESYQLTIDSKHITISAEEGGAGNFYGLQTLIQLLPVEKSKELSLPCIQIKDAPRFQWRGMHLDVCRHFYPISFIKKYIDLIALYKMNTFHWHLTEDQGWRIEIKKYPKLTQVGAWRKGTMVGAYRDQKFDSIPYGGFYTQEEIKDIVAYAAKKHITVVPEIEMPGHSVAAIAAYPWLSCTGKPKEVEKGWGVFEDVYCTKDSTFNFLQDVLDEVMALFPSNYIHIGGDECPKTRWKTCTHCQSMIKKEHLKDEHELQSYFIKRIEKYVNSKGKQIIGWDEILEGGLAPNAAVMSWQGISGGIAAAKQKHNVVMTPGSHCYFDHYQAFAADEPLAIGGYTPLEKVYAYEPIPAELNIEEQKYILGAQANVWTEYILNEKQVEYMAFPRMAALAEVLWTPKEKKNETDFLTRLQKHFSLLDKLDVNYAKALYKVEQKISKEKNIQLELKANPSLGEIRYTVDGSEPTAQSLKYQQPIELTKNVTVKAALFQNTTLKGKISGKSYVINKASNKEVMLKNPPSKSYSGNGSFTLVNGVIATLPRISEQWLGWNGNDLEAVINLKEEQEVSEMKIGFLKDELSWIYLPKEIEFLISNDGINFNSIGKVNSENISQERFAIANIKTQKVKYVKIVAKNFGKIPSGKPGAGEGSWLFCDEIMIN